MPFRVLLAVLALAAAVAGCAVVSKIDPGRVTIKNAFSVQTPVEWAAIDIGDLYVWTVDGPVLQQLRFVAGVEDGEPMLTGPDRDKLPKFRATMNELEVLEFFHASMAAGDIRSLQTANMRPADFGGKAGFRFEYTFMSKEGLAVSGFATGAVVDKKLHMIIYSGATEHYFGKHRRDAEAVMASVQFL